MEEVISFSALENIHELTCVSLLGVTVDEIRCQLLSNSHSCKTSRGTPSQGQNPSPVHSKGKADDLEVDDKHEVLRQEDVGTISIKALHLQLRRLVKDSNFSDDVVLTAIPEQKSKVMFCFENDATKLFSPVSVKSTKVKRSSSARNDKDKIVLTRAPHSRPYSQDTQSEVIRHTSSLEENPFDAAPQPKLLKQKSSSSKEKSDESIPLRTKEKVPEKQSIGYIMFECGFEEISIAAVKRLGYKDKADNNMDDFTIEQEKFHDQEMESDKHMEGNQSTSPSGSKECTTDSTQVKSGQIPTVTIESDTGHVPASLQKSTLTVGSWTSRVSIPSDSSVSVNASPLFGDASNGRLHLKTIWFNFAAPPPLPIKRKADFTK